MARSYLKVYFDFDEKTDELNDSEKARLLLAMYKYAKTGEKPTLTGNERFLFSTFKGEIDRDIANYNVKVANGNLGGRPAKEQTENNQTEPKETETKPKETETAKNKEQEIKNKKDIKENPLKGVKENALERLFEKFWAVYPRREGKQGAKKAFMKIAPDDKLLDTMLEAVQRQKGTDQWSDPRYIPHAQTWLNGRRWEDEPPTVTAIRQTKSVEARQYSSQRDYDEDDLEKRLGVMDIFKGAV